MSLAQIREPPDKGLVLLAGPPGSGKSTFCNQVVLNSLASNRPVIFVTTERNPSDLIEHLGKHGLGELRTGLRIVDAFSETVGLISPDLPNTVRANSMNLNSLSMAITKLGDSLRRKGILLAFDSLTSPYLFGGANVVKFMGLFLSRFAAEGNSVLALIDEGCGREEDLVAMMSVADGILKMEVKDESRFLSIVKHPVLEPTRIEMPTVVRTSIPSETMDAWITKLYKARGDRRRRTGHRGRQAGEKRASLRQEAGDFVNVFWRSLAFWSCMLWDPKRFPTMVYDLTKELTFEGASLWMGKLPLHVKLIHRFLPKRNFRSPDFVEKRIVPIWANHFQEEGGGKMEYQLGISSPDEHHIRICEGASSWGLENVGVSLCYDHAGYLAGFFKFFDSEKRDWNAVETTCRGCGSPCCEFKVAPGELDELEGFLTAMDGARVERIIDLLMEEFRGFIVDKRPLGERPSLGRGVHIEEFVHLLTLPALASERYRMAVRAGGAMAGKRLGECLMGLDQGEGKAIDVMVNLLEYSNVGKVVMGETMRIRENCESSGMEVKQPTCFFTTGFLNGFFSTVKNQHVKETKCIGLGDPFCEWEFR